jgi:hypothetical protein
MLLTIELPDETIVKHEVLDTMTLKEIAELVHVRDPVFFCYRWRDELGTLMSMTSSDQPISYFNTNSIALIDRNHIKEKDVPRYYNALKKGY